MNARIIKIISNNYTVFYNNKLYICKARGKFRKLNLQPAVGDFCDIDLENNYILNIHDRKNYLQRPTIANVDIGLIIMSVKEPDLSLYNLDKILVHIIYNKICPVIVFTKIDLVENKEELFKIKKYYESLKIPVYFNDELEKIKKIIKNKVVVLTGQTGAGKSTLLNKLDQNLHIKTSPISKALNRGKHTTTHTELYNICSSLIADTPGFSSLSLSYINKEDLKNSFLEFSNFTCPFNDCLHINERNCAVKNAVTNNIILKSRYENYLNFSKEVGK